MAQRRDSQWHDLDWVCVCSGGAVVKYQVTLPPVNLWNYTKIDYWRNEMTERSVDKKTEVRSTEEALSTERALKLALEYLRDNQHYIADNERHAYVMEYNAFVERLEALAEQPAQQQEPVCDKDPQGCWSVRCQLGKVCKNKYPPASKPLFKEFIKWAGAQGYDCAQTCNSDTGEWICLNPMTADLWKAWQAAHSGIKGDA